MKTGKFFLILDYSKISNVGMRIVSGRQYLGYVHNGFHVIYGMNGFQDHKRVASHVLSVLYIFARGDASSYAPHAHDVDRTKMCGRVVCGNFLAETGSHGFRESQTRGVQSGQ